MSSQGITVVDLSPRPTLIHQLEALFEKAVQGGFDIVLNFSHINVLDTDEFVLLLRIEEVQKKKGQRTVLCGVTTTLWGTREWLDPDRAFVIVSDQRTAVANLKGEA